MNRSICTALLVLTVAAAPAWSQGKLDAHTMKAFGGTYQIDCSSNTSPKATVFADALVFLDGDKRVAGSKVQAAAAYFGNSPPPDYRTVLLSEIPGGQELLFTIYEDKSGYYLKLDGDKKTMAAIGKPLAGKKFRHCDGAAKPMQTAAAPVAKSKTKEAWEYLQEPAFKSAYAKALGPKVKTPWLAKRDGPSPQDKFVQVAGDKYVMNSFCKNHDCSDNSAVLLYSPDKKLVYGTFYEKGKTTLIGDPPAPVAAELATLWKKEWRSQLK